MAPPVAYPRDGALSSRRHFRNRHLRGMASILEFQGIELSDKPGTRQHLADRRIRRHRIRLPSRRPAWQAPQAHGYSGHPGSVTGADRPDRFDGLHHVRLVVRDEGRRQPLVG